MVIEQSHVQDHGTRESLVRTHVVQLDGEKGSIERDCGIIDFSYFCEGLALLISSESLLN